MVVTVFEVLCAAQQRERCRGDGIDDHDNFSSRNLEQGRGFRRVFCGLDEGLEGNREGRDSRDAANLGRKGTEVGKEQMACRIGGTISDQRSVSTILRRRKLRGSYAAQFL